MAPGQQVTALEGARTVLDLTAMLMEAAFEELGEGTILASMPGYLERFGEDNARYLAKHGTRWDPAQGAVAALTPMNVVSRLTGTPFTMVEATRRQAVKRLHACEFQEAFADRGGFPRTMICQLHGAAYQGSVNGLVERPEDGYDVEVRSRILFGDGHCDFCVRSRSERPDTPDQEGESPSPPPEEELAALNVDFYAFILASFVDYMEAMLPPERVAAHVLGSARQAGSRLQGRRGFRGDAGTVLRDVLHATGHRFAEGARGALVTYCPNERGIRDATRRSPPERAAEARRQAGRMCAAILEGAIAEAVGPVRVRRERTEHAGGTAWHYRVEPEGAAGEGER